MGYVLCSGQGNESEKKAAEKMQLAQAAIAASEYDLQAAGVLSAIQEEQTRVAELENKERRQQLSAIFRRNQVKCVEDQRKLKLAEGDFIVRFISAEEFLAEWQQAEATEAKRLDDAAKAASIIYTTFLAVTPPLLRGFYKTS